jgi:hypothetical protein
MACLGRAGMGDITHAFIPLRFGTLGPACAIVVLFFLHL